MTTGEAARDLFCTGFRLRKATRRATQIYDHALAPHGLTVTQYSLLALLARDGAMPMSRLAERAGMDRTSMTRTIRPLAAEKFVTLSGASDDKRLRIVALTSSGNAVFESALAAWQDVQRHVNRALGRDRLAMLHELLGDVSLLADPEARSVPARAEGDR